MFTGLVTHCVPALSVERRGTGLVLAIPNPWAAAPGRTAGETGPRAELTGPRAELTRAPDPVALGESIAVSGACLTVAEPPGPTLVFELSAETLARTWFSELAPGRRLNLERSLRLSDRLGGHMVSGHVDATGEVVEVVDTGDGGRRLAFQAPEPVARYLIEKGSVTIDGVSLTVVSPRAGRFDVALIPSTLAATSLGVARPGTRVHLEADLVGKWIEKLFPGR